MLAWTDPLCGLSCGSFDKLLECKASHSINQRGFSWRPSAECRMALKVVEERNTERIGRRVLDSSFFKFDRDQLSTFYFILSQSCNWLELKKIALCFLSSNLISATLFRDLLKHAYLSACLDQWSKVFAGLQIYVVVVPSCIALVTLVPL